MGATDLQKRIHDGDREAFRAVYANHARGVYLRALKELGEDGAARGVVKQVFLNLHRELLRADSPIDIPARIETLADEELMLRQILGSAADVDTLRAPKPAARADGRREAPPPPPPPIADNADHLPPLDRTRAYMRYDRAAARESAPPAPRRKRRRTGWFLGVPLTMFLLLFLWSLAGVCMDFGWIPTVDIGYGWFNEHIFTLFRYWA